MDYCLCFFTFSPEAVCSFSPLRCLFVLHDCVSLCEFYSFFPPLSQLDSFFNRREPCDIQPVVCLWFSWLSKVSHWPKEKWNRDLFPQDGLNKIFVVFQFTVYTWFKSGVIFLGYMKQVFFWFTFPCRKTKLFTFSPHTCSTFMQSLGWSLCLAVT